MIHQFFAVFLVFTVHTGPNPSETIRSEVTECQPFDGPFYIPPEGERDLYGKKGDGYYCWRKLKGFEFNLAPWYGDRSPAE